MLKLSLCPPSAKSLPLSAPILQKIKPRTVSLPGAGSRASGGRSPEDRVAPDHGRRTRWPKPRRQARKD
ncbi:hypothetical protein BT93_B3069 [Corymbia citriodora subsp. variegata]|nr:hypothetical protein BT93_B3069 [Corymbia citriodora subsp. variegata]